MRCYVRHARAVECPNQKGYCVDGMQTWFEANNLDFRDFVRNGIEAETLRATGDMMALAVIEQAEQEAAENGRIE